MNSTSLKRFLIIFVFLITAAFVLNGCSGGGDSDSTTPTPDTSSDGTIAPTDTTDTSGTTTTTGGTDGTTGSGTTGTTTVVTKATVSGLIDLASISGSDLASLSASLGKVSQKAGSRSDRLNATDFTTDAIVKLMTMNETGDLVDSGLTGTLTAATDGTDTVSFDFSEVPAGVNYIVRYLKLADNGEVLELKANAYVPEGATTQEGTVTVDPSQTVIVEALVDAVINATSGSGIDATIINNIIEAVKTTIVTLVESGIIQIPSMIVEATGTTLTDILAEDIVNTNVDSASGLVLSDTSVDAELGVAQAEAQATRFSLTDVSTTADKEVVIDKVFAELFKNDGGGGIPPYQMDFLKDAYVNDKTVTLSQLITGISEGVNFDQQGQSITKSGAVTAFQTLLAGIYAIQTKQAAGTVLSDAEKTTLAETPPVILGLFPQEFGVGLTDTTVLNVPQALAITIYIVDKYITEALGLTETVTASSADGTGVTTETQKGFEFDPFKLFELWGFKAYVTNLGGGIDIFDLWIHPQTAWIETAPGQGGEEKDMLVAGTCVGDILSMMNMMDGTTAGAVDLSTAAVTLTYPTAAGSATIALVEENSLNDMGMHGGPGPGMRAESCFIIDPWRETWDPNCMGDCFVDLNASGRVVSDFASGTYTVSVTPVNGTATTREFTKKIITGMRDAIPVLTNPAGMPNWPGDAASDAEKTAFDNAMRTYSESRFAANEDTTGDGVLDKLSLTVKWDAPAVTLPAGVKMAYSLDIGQGGCDNNGCTWDHIYSTWDGRGKLIFNNSFIVPVKLAKDATRPYEMNMSVEFIDGATGEKLGQGGWAHTRFWVADPIDTTLEFSITGAADSANKVALLMEYDDPDLLGNSWVREAISTAIPDANGVYTLTQTIGAFIGDNAKAGAWFNIVQFLDTDGTAGFSDGDQQIWPNPGDNIWFDTMGGQLRVVRDICDETATTTNDPSMGPGNCSHTETSIMGGEIVSGPSWKVLTAADKLLSFTVSGIAIDGATVALVREYEDSTAGYTQEVVTSAVATGGVYELAPTIGELLARAEGWIQLVMYQDDGNGISWETQLTWPDPDKNVHFDTFGGTLKVGVDSCTVDANGTIDWFSCNYEELFISGGETIAGIDFPTTLGGGGTGNTSSGIATTDTTTAAPETTTTP